MIRDSLDHPFRDDDIVVGVFLGEPDLVVMPSDPNQSHYGQVLIANLMDVRGDWPTAAPSLASFLRAFIAAQGQWFWQPASP